jgi:transmembrane E3 ubiquitin-protein ligase
MFVITAIIAIEVIILEIQKYIGPKFILPKFMKKISYNYYLNKAEEEEIKNSKTVVILFLN